MMNEPGSGRDYPDNDNYNDDKRWAAAERRGNVLTGICILLAVAIAGLAWYAYPMLKTWSVTQRLTETRDAVSDRLKEAEAQRSLREQASDLGRNLRGRIETASKQASQSAEGAYHRLEDKMKTAADGLAGMKARVQGLESSREADQFRIAQLTQALNQVREEAEQQAIRQSADLDLLRRQMEESGSSENQQLAAIQQDEQRDQRNIDAVSGQIAVQKIPFEADKNHTRDVGDGIWLTIDDTDTMYRQVSGRMWVSGDHRNIWLHNQSAQEPVIFYGYGDGKKHELVITNVTQNSVTGYLLAPKQQMQTAALGDGADANTGVSAQ
jgi:hypothetical protein